MHRFGVCHGKDYSPFIPQSFHPPIMYILPVPHYAHNIKEDSNERNKKQQTKVSSVTYDYINQHNSSTVDIHHHQQDCTGRNGNRCNPNQLCAYMMNTSATEQTTTQSGLKPTVQPTVQPVLNQLQRSSQHLIHRLQTTVKKLLRLWERGLSTINT